MYPGTIAVLLLAGSALASAAALAQREPLADLDSRDDSTTPLSVRRAWQTLSNAEKKAYIDAELCLMQKPATLGLRGARTKFDELQSVHTLQTEIIHFVGQFLPWHRLFVYAHEHQLKTICGYTGTHPYWNETLDGGNFAASDIFDPVTGFGGDGDNTTGRVASGPFSSYINNMGPGYAVGPHYITRNFSEGVFFSQAAEPIVVNTCSSYDTFVEFWHCLESGPHSAGHAGIMGEMVDPVSSPGDPIFFMHHAYLDRVWAKWQDQDPKNRLYQVGGNNHVNLTSPYPYPEPFFAVGLNISASPGPLPVFTGTNAEQVLGAIFLHPRPDDVPEPLVFGDCGQTTTRNQILQMYGLIANKTIGDVMNTRLSLGYEYD